MVKMDIRKGIEEGGWKKAMKQKQYLICAIYLILVAVAEFSMTLDYPKSHVFGHGFIARTCHLSEQGIDKSRTRTTIGS
jgi:hypothetical protein